MKLVLTLTLVICSSILLGQAPALEQVALNHFTKEIAPNDPLINRSKLVLALKSTRSSSSFERLSSCLNFYAWFDVEDTPFRSKMIDLDRNQEQLPFIPIVLKSRNLLFPIRLFRPALKNLDYQLEVKNLIEYEGSRYVEIMARSRDKQTNHYYFLRFDQNNEYVDHCHLSIEY